MSHSGDGKKEGNMKEREKMEVMEGVGGKWKKGGGKKGHCSKVVNEYN